MHRGAPSAGELAKNKANDLEKRVEELEERVEELEDRLERLEEDDTDIYT